jgi:hypothetical protein
LPYLFSLSDILLITQVNLFIIIIHAKALFLNPQSDRYVFYYFYVINMQLIFQLATANGKITCARCQAMSKRTRQQCGAPAEKGKRVCRFHGSRSTGPKTEAGRLRVAHGKTLHGNETRQARAERSAMSAKILVLEDILFLINAATGVRTRGRKPANFSPVSTLDDAIKYMLANPITL